MNPVHISARTDPVNLDFYELHRLRLLEYGLAPAVPSPLAVVEQSVLQQEGFVIVLQRVTGYDQMCPGFFR